MSEDATYWAFLHFFHMDKANAAIHCSPVRFSPITFRLVDLLDDPEFLEAPEVVEVLNHNGKYALDMGR